MLDLQLPALHDWAVQERNYGKLVIEPFEPSFALTVGIAYRRALLSGIHGTAPVWAKIEHVLHEFSHLPGVTEDTLDIMMNLRKVVFVLHVNRPKILRLKAQGRARSGRATLRGTPTSRSSPRTYRLPRSTGTACSRWRCASSAAAATCPPRSTSPRCCPSTRSCSTPTF